MSAELLIALIATAAAAFACGWIVGDYRDRHASRPARSRTSPRRRAAGRSQPTELTPPPVPADRLVADLERARGIRPTAGRGFRTTPPPGGTSSRPFVPPWARSGVEVKAARARARRASESREGPDPS